MGCRGLCFSRSKLGWRWEGFRWSLRWGGRGREGLSLLEGIDGFDIFFGGGSGQRSVRANGSLSARFIR